MSDFTAGAVFGSAITCGVLGGIVWWFTLTLRNARETYFRLLNQGTGAMRRTLTQNVTMRGLLEEAEEVMDQLLIAVDSRACRVREDLLIRIRQALKGGDDGR